MTGLHSPFFVRSVTNQEQQVPQSLITRQQKKAMNPQTEVLLQWHIAI